MKHPLLSNGGESTFPKMEQSSGQVRVRQGVKKFTPLIDTKKEPPDVSPEALQKGIGI